MEKSLSFLFSSLFSVVLSLSQLPAYAQIPAVAPTATTTKPAYFVAEFQLTDPEGIKPYSAQVESTFRPYSGQFVVRSGVIDIKEGFNTQRRLIMIRFDSLEQANAWYNSPGYQSLIPIRQRSGNARTFIVEGLKNK